MVINLKKIKKLRKLLVLIPFKYRFVNYNEFKRYYDLLKKLETLSRMEIETYQLKMLKTILDLAYNNTEFYRIKYDRAGFNPSMLKTLSDIDKIPFLTRDELKENSPKMIVSGRKGPLLKGMTSGTTGNALEVFYDREAFSREWAAQTYLWEKVGYKYGDGRIEFRAFMEKGDYELFPETRVLRINILKMNESNIDKILDRIKKTGYRFFHGYPSAIYKFARLLENRTDYSHPKAILFSSEMLYDWQLKYIKSMFPDSDWIDFYGMAEHVCMAVGNKDRSYSFIPGYGITEFIGDNLEIVGTSLTNFIMPIIRYKLSDSVRAFTQQIQFGNINLFPVAKSLTGRIEEYTYTSEGELVPPAVVTFPFKSLKCIRACKIIQYSYTDFEFIVEGFDNPEIHVEIDKILTDLKKIYGTNVKFSVVIKSEFLLNPTGKFSWIECRFKP